MTAMRGAAAVAVVKANTERMAAETMDGSQTRSACQYVPLVADCCATRQHCCSSLRIQRVAVGVVMEEERAQHKQLLPWARQQTQQAKYNNGQHEKHVSTARNDSLGVLGTHSNRSG